jgi:ketosteroid isomerase-like protein
MADEPTTPDLVALTRRWLEVAPDVHAAMSFVAPDALFDLSTRGLGVFEGAAAIRAFIEDYFGAFDELAYELEDAADFGGGVTFAVVAQHARPVGSPAPVRMREGYIVVWEEGMIVRGSSYSDVDEARAAAERLAEARG